MASALADAEASMPGTLPLFSLDDLEPPRPPAEAQAPAGAAGAPSPARVAESEPAPASGEEAEPPRWRDDPSTAPGPDDGPRNLESLLLSSLANADGAVCLVCDGAVDLLADGGIVCTDCGTVVEWAGSDETDDDGGRRGVWVA